MKLKKEEILMSPQNTLKYLVFLTLLTSFLSPSKAFSARKHPFSPRDMWSMGRVSGPEVSPDGKLAAFSVTYYDIDKNKGNSDIWIVRTDGNKPPVQLTRNEAMDVHPRFMPDSQSIMFLSSRSGSMQLWKIPVNGGEAGQVSDFSVDIEGFELSPDGSSVALSARIFPSCTTLKCSGDRLKKYEEKKNKARIIDRLPSRMWNYWRDERRGHILLFNLKTKAEPRDITPGDIEIPPLDLACGPVMKFSPDGKEISFTASPPADRAWSTNNDVYTVQVRGGKYRKVSTGKACDCGGVYSPDGTYLAWLAMKRPVFEADARKIMIHDRRTGKSRILETGMDLSVSELVWRNQDELLFTAVDRGRVGIFRIRLAGGKAGRIFGSGTQHSIKPVPESGSIVFAHSDFSHPWDIYRLDMADSKTRKLTDINREILDSVSMGKPEEFWFTGARGDKVHSFMIKPPGFNSKKQYPLLHLIHGGPQGAWVDGFHWRWNAQLYACAGYVVLMVNFHASPGYGQDFVDSVSRNWGTLPYEDIMKGLDYVLENNDFVDENRLGASGASYGGFMINWIMGHTDRFKALVSHDGVYEQHSMYGATEELWFPEWEFNGVPWGNPLLYDCFSPSRYAARFTTPTLVIHGENDYRVPYTQGMQLFTALQRRGVPSRMLYFHDEDHFVTKPLNAILWWDEIFGWLGSYLHPEGYTGPDGKPYSGPPPAPMKEIIDKMPQCTDYLPAEGPKNTER